MIRLNMLQQLTRDFLLSFLITLCTHVFGGRLKYLNFWTFSALIFSHCSNFWKAQCKYYFTYLTVTPTFGGVAKSVPRVHPL